MKELTIGNRPHPLRVDLLLANERRAGDSFGREVHALEDLVDAILDVLHDCDLGTHIIGINALGEEPARDQILGLLQHGSTLGVVGNLERRWPLACDQVQLHEDSLALDVENSVPLHGRLAGGPRPNHHLGDLALGRQVLGLHGLPQHWDVSGLRGRTDVSDVLLPALVKLPLIEVSSGPRLLAVDDVLHDLGCPPATTTTRDSDAVLDEVSSSSVRVSEHSVRHPFGKAGV